MPTPPLTRWPRMRAPFGMPSGDPARSPAVAARSDFTGALEGARAGVVTATDSYLPGKSAVGAVIGDGFKRHRGPRLDFSLNGSNVFHEAEIIVAAFTPAGREIEFTTSINF